MLDLTTPQTLMSYLSYIEKYFLSPTLLTSKWGNIMQESSSKSKNKFSFETKELKVPVFESMSRIGTLRIYRIIK